MNIKKVLEDNGLTTKDLWARTFQILELPMKKVSVTCPIPGCEKKSEGFQIARNGKLYLDFPNDRFYCQRCNFRGKGLFATLKLLEAIRNPADEQSVYQELFSNGRMTQKAQNYVSELLGLEVDMSALSNSQSNKDMIVSNAIQEMVKENRKKISAIPEAKKPTHDTYLNEIYSYMFKNMLYQSSPKMEEDLLKRGFTPEDILKYGFVSCQLSKPMNTLLKKFNGDLDCIPGIYRKGALIETTLPQARNANESLHYLCPIKNINNEIVGAQIKNMGENKDFKYFFWSSTSEGGPITRTSPHFVGFPEETLIVTEGVVKANVINKFTGRYVAGLPGVNHQKPFLEALRIAERKGMGIQRILVAYDMDSFENEKVMKALDRLNNELVKAGYEVKNILWDTNFKGFDDYLFHLHQNNLLDAYIREVLDEAYKK